ncbi:phosphosulfolactate synthase [Lacticaseibacillus hegangensis]|uniref:Phosphosulfolactate synthase n=1 Tax=Lacticaseibacillus hegangensis TaxID=2486010 RepID=A0ABW4CSS1_9LACO|nr:phosphosulfolactate synthase [Lacticaseibacillus hegangensis]
MKAYAFLKNTPKTTTPRGKTMMLDKGLGLNETEDLLATAGDYLDYAKFGWGTAATMDRELIQQKTAKYQAAGVIPYPGGTLLEVALMNGQFNDFLKETQALGFGGVEVSDGSTTIAGSTRKQVIQQAKDAGLFVISEVGKKDPTLDHELSIHERLMQIQADLQSGANYVIIEAREAGKNIGIYDAEGNIIEDELQELAKGGTDQLIFEAPLKSQQVALIRQFGVGINLGNIASNEVTALETLRRGLRGDTVGQL